MPSQTKQNSAREVVEELLATAVDPDPDKYPDLWADEFVIEMPFAPPWFPKRSTSTNAELRERFKDRSTKQTYDRIDSVVIHDTGNPEVVIAEYKVHGRRTVDDEPFVLPYINVYTVRDGRIVHSKDHSDPIVASQAFGMLPALIESLSTEPGAK